jgi:N-acetylglucosamine-6-phosphate deacetylase
MKFIDIQVNGYAGVDFRAPDMTEALIQHVAKRLHSGGVRAILPTITTDAVPIMAARLARMRELIDQEKSLRALMPAFHIEGPCISPEEGYRGAHPAEHIKPATPGLFKRLLDAAGGPERVAIVTLAPEGDKNMRTTRWLAEQGITVSLGHTNATLAQFRDAEAAGARLFTHLGNGCANLIQRHDNVLNRALALERIRYAMIGDGHHLPWFVLRTWIGLIGIERCLLTTDCVEAADAPRGYAPTGLHVLDVSAGTPVVRFKGTPYLAGSAATMQQVYDNAVQHVGLTKKQAAFLTCDQPATMFRKYLR